MLFFDNKYFNILYLALLLNNIFLKSNIDKDELRKKNLKESLALQMSELQKASSQIDEMQKQYKEAYKKQSSQDNNSLKTDNNPKSSIKSRLSKIVNRFKK